MFKQTNKTNLMLLVAKQMSRSFRFVLFLLALTGVFLYTRAGAPARVEAAVSSELNFQARLLNSNGGIVPDGDYNVEFKLYDSLSAGGSSQGTCVGGVTDDCMWMETRTGGNKVTVHNGYLSVHLGEVTAFGSINWDQQLYLTMNIGGTGAPSWDGEMSPRLQLTAVPYAFQSVRAEQLAKTVTGNLGQLLFPAGLGQATTYNLVDPGQANVSICLSTGNCGGAGATLQSTYNNSTPARITLNNTSGGLEIRDNSTPLGTALFSVLSNNGSTSYLSVDATGISVTGSGDFTDNLTAGDAPSDTLTVDATAAFNTDANFTFAGSENLAVTTDLAGSVDAISVVATPSTTSGTTRGLFIQQADNANSNGLDSGVLVDNADTNLAVGDAITITNSGGGGYNNLLNTPSLDITGAGAITGATGIATTGNFTQTGTGTFGTGTGAVSLNGATSVTGSNTFSTGTGAVSLNGATTVTGSNTFTSGTGTVLLQGNTDIANTASLATKAGATYTTAGSANNVAISTASLYRLDTSGAPQVITGIVAGRDGQMLTLINGDTASAVTLSNENNASSANNRIVTGSGGDITMPVGGSVTLVYDSTDSRWRIVGLSASSSGGANQQLSNLSGTVAVNLSLNPGGDNTLDLGSATNSWRTLYADTSVLTPSIDVASAGALAIGNSTATSVSICNSAACDTITIGTNNDADAISIGDATDTFSLASTGLNVSTAGALSGITGYAQASGNFAISGSGTFGTGTGAISLNGNTTVTGTRTFTVNSGATTLGGSLDVTGTVGFASTVNVNGGTLNTDDTTFNLLNSTATTVNAFGDATTLNIGADGISITGGGALTITAGGTDKALSLQSSGTGAVTLGTSATSHSTTVGSTTGSSTLTLQAGSGGIVLGASTLKRTAAGTTTLDLIDGSDTTFAVTNTGAGAANFTVDGSITAGTGLTVTAGGATITAGDIAITAGNLSTGGTQRLSNAGALNNITGYSQSSGNFAITGAGTFSTGTGAISLNGATSVTGSNTFTSGTGTVTLQGNTNISSSVSLATQAGTTYTTAGSANDVAISTASLYRLDTSGVAQVITGIAAGRDGQILTLVSADASLAFTLNNLDGASTAANQISTGTGANLSVPAGNAITLIYDSTSSLWRVVGSTATAGSFANQQLSNLSGTVAVNLSLNPGADNTLDLGSAANSWRTLYADTSVLTPTIDTASAGALGIGNSTATSVSICNSAACDTIDIGTNSDADTITVGDSNDTIGINGTLTVTGGTAIVGATDINVNANNATNINTGSSTSLVSIGGGNGTFSLQTTNIDISSSGAISGATGYAQSSGAFAFSGGGNFSLDSAAFDVTTAGVLSGITGYTQTSGNFAISGTGTFSTGTGTVSLNGATTVTGSSTFTSGTGAVTLQGNTDISNTVSLATKAGATYTTAGSANDVAISTASLYRLDTSGAAQVITGIAAGRDGQILTLVSADASLAFTLNNLDGASSAANQISTGTGTNLSVPAGNAVTLIYDATSSLWRVIGSSATAGGFANVNLSNITNTNLSAALNVTSGNLQLQTTTSGDITLTTATASGLANVLTGNLKVGNGSPDVTLNGEDTYIEGALEVDGVARFDGTLTANSTSTFTGLATFNGDLTLEAGDTLTFNGDAITDATGSGIVLNSGALTVDATTSTGFFRNGGNDFGGNAVLGTNGAGQTLGLETAGTTRAILDASGNLAFQQATTISTSTGALTLQPVAGSNLNVTLSGTGDFVVNTDDLVVDTSAGFVGIGDATPAALLTVGNGDLFQVDSSGAIAAATGITMTGNFTQTGSGTFSTGTGTVSLNGATTVSTTLAVNGNTTLGDASGDTLTINGTAVTIPNNLNFDANTLFIDAANNRIGIGDTAPGTRFSVKASNNASTGGFRLVASGNNNIPVNFYGLGANGDNGILQINNGVSNTIQLTGSSNANYINSGNFGIGDGSPDALFTVGTNSEFQVNGSGAIAAATGITTTGNFSQTGAGTFGTGTGAVSLNGATTITGTNTFTTGTGAVTLQGNTDVAATVSLATKAGATYTTAGSANNVAISTASLYRLDTSGAAQVITGIAAGRDGQILTLVSADASLSFTLNNLDGASSSANQISTGTGTNLAVPVGGAVTLIYDATSSLWRVVGSSATTGGFANVNLSNITNTNLSAALNVTSGDLQLQTTTSGNITLTTATASGLANVLGGNLKVGNGTPDIALNGEDAYVEGTLEVDGTSRFDNTLTVTAGGIAVTGNSTITGTLTGLTGLTSSGTITFSGLTADRLVTTTSGGQLTNSISSANLAASITDETGTGLAVFGTSPNITTSLTTGSSSFDLLNANATTINAFGAADTINIGADGATITSGGALTIQAGTTAGANKAVSIYSAGTGTLTLDSTGAGTVNIGNAGATTINLGANNVAHTIHIGDGGSSTAQTVTIGSTFGSSTTTLQAGSGGIILNASTLSRTAAGTTTLNLINGSDTTLALQNSGAGNANLTVDGTITAGAGLTVTSGGATITAGDLAITAGNLTTGGTQRLSNAGALSNITGYSQTSGTANIATTDANALRVQNSGASETLLNVDSTARSGSGGNLIKVGNSTGTDTATTVLQLDATQNTDITTNVSVLSGGLYYFDNTSDNTLDGIRGIVNGSVVTVCDSRGNCAGAGTTLQTAYNNSATSPEIKLNSTNNGIQIQDADTTLGATTDLFAILSSNAASNLFRIQGNGNVGIGTSSNPASALSIGGTTGNFQVNSSGAIAAATGITTSGNFTQTGAGTFGTGTGAVSLNGATSVTGSNTFSTGTGAVSLNGATTVTGSNTFTSGTGAVLLQGNTDIANTVSLATQAGATYTTAGSANNVAISTASLYRLDTSGAPQVITGIVAGRNGQMLTLVSADASASFTLNNLDGASSVANQISTGTGTNISVPVGNAVTLIYDATSSLWRVIGSTATAGGYANVNLSNITATNLSAALNVTSGNLQLQTTTSGDITLTTATASGLANVLTGNLKVGNGTPDVTLNGEDAYIEGTLEVDGDGRFDGNASINGMAAIGSNASVQTPGQLLGLAGGETFTTTLDIAETFTDLASTDLVTGTSTQILLDPAATVTAGAIAHFTHLQTDAGNTEDYGSIAGEYTTVSHLGDGDIGFFLGTSVGLLNGGAGTVSVANGASANIQNDSNGIIALGNVLSATFQNIGTVGTGTGVNSQVFNTGTATTLVGIGSVLQNDATGVTDTLAGAALTVENVGDAEDVFGNQITITNSGTVSGSLVGTDAIITNTGSVGDDIIGNRIVISTGGSANIAEVNGNILSISNTGTGTITSAIGFAVGTTTNSGGGAITDIYGGLIAPQTAGSARNIGLGILETSGGSNANANLALGAIPTSGNYSIYNSSTDQNYFAGNLGIGDATPAALLTVGNGDLFQINSSGDVTTANGENLSITTGTTGSLTIDTGTTGDISIGTNANAKTVTVGNTTGSTSVVINTGSGGASINSGAVAGGATTLRVTPGAHTAVTAEVINLDIQANTQTITGSYATQRFNVFGQSTITAGSALTVTNAATVAIAGAPVRAGSAAITNTHALLIQAGAVSTATNSYGLTVNAQTGATNNYSAAFLGGNVGIGTAAPTEELHIASGDIRISDTGAAANSPSEGRLIFDNQFDNSGNTTANKIVLFDNGTSFKAGIGLSNGDFDLFNGTGGNFRLYTGHVSEATQGTEIFTILGTGQVGIGTAAPTADLTFGEGASRTISVLTRSTNAAGSALTISGGTAGSGASAFTGGVLTLQGGNAGGTGNANGANVLLRGGTGVGTGVSGIVEIDTPVFTASSTQSFGSNGTISQSVVDSNSTIPVDATAGSLTITLPAPTITTVGRIIYITSVSGSNSFTIAPAGGTNFVMNANMTGTFVWNGVNWTNAGVDGGSASYIQNQTAVQQAANFRINGTGRLANLDIDTSGTLGIGTGTTSGQIATGITIGNATNNTTLTINTGTGAVNISDNAGTKAIDIGGNDTDGADTIRISTNATSADIITIGSTHSSSTSTLVGGAYSLTARNTGVGINTGSNAPSADLTFGDGANRTINVLGRTTNAAGNNLTVSAGAAGSGGSAFSGGTLTLQGGAAGGTGNANGGSITISGGAGVGTGTQGLVNLSTTAFSSASVQTFGSSTSVTAGNVDLYSTIPVTASTTGLTLTVPDPGQATIGRIIYIAARSGSNDFTLRLNATRTPIDIAMKANSTATLIWNGTDWTAAGASSSTDLQSAYNNTLTSAGGAEIVLNPSGGAADGFTIRNNATTPITGGILEVQSSIGTNLFSVNNFGTELAANGGSETSSTWSTNWTAVGSATVSRTTTSGEFVTGLAGAEAATTASATDGIRNNLSGNPATGSITYQVSFSVKASSAITSTLNVQYSPDGGSTLVPCSAYSSQSVSTSIWTKITCTITTGATAVTNPDLLIRQGDTTARNIWVENLSFMRNDSTTQPSNVQIGGGINGGPVTLFTLDRSTAPPVANGDTTYLGSMYYDTTTGRIQCYEADGWGACGSAPDNIITLTPEYTGAVLNGTGVGTLTADFCANQASVLQVNHTTLCTTSGEARNFYRWTSPQASEQSYKIYVTYKLPNTFKAFADANTMKLTTLTTDTTLAEAYFRVFKKDVSSGTLASCGSATEINSSADTWQQTSFGGDETACGFEGGDYIIFEIEVQAEDSESIYIENLDFTYTNR